MPEEKKPVQVSPGKNFAEYEGTSIALPKPIEQMTEQDWVKIALGSKSQLRKISVDNQSLLGLHVVLKDKNYRPVWLYDSRGKDDIPRAFDMLERAINMGAQLCTIDDIEVPCSFRASADGHIHRDDVILAKIPHVVYWSLQSQFMQDSRARLEYQSVEGKAYEGNDVPRYIKGNKDVPIFETTEHRVDYQDRPKF